MMLEHLFDLIDTKTNNDKWLMTNGLTIVNWSSSFLVDFVLAEIKWVCYVSVLSSVEQQPEWWVYWLIYRSVGQRLDDVSVRVRKQETKEKRTRLSSRSSRWINFSRSIVVENGLDWTREKFETKRRANGQTLLHGNTRSGKPNKPAQHQKNTKEQREN